MGNLAVSDNITVTLYDQTDNMGIGSHTVAGLAPGASQTLTFSWNSSTAIAAGPHSLLAGQLRPDSNSGNDTGSASVFATQPLSLTSVVPNAVPMGTSTPLTIIGTGFINAAALQFWNGSGPQPAASNIVVVNSTRITATLNVGDDNSTQDRNWNVRVVNPGGATAAYAGVLTVLGDAPQNTPPQVGIATPANNALYALGAGIAVSGSASDAEDGNLTPSLAWTSSLTGPIGNGGSFNWTPAVAGTHLITASVVDSAGLTATATRTIAVSPNSPPIITVSSPSGQPAVTPGTAVTLAASASACDDHRQGYVGKVLQKGARRGQDVSRTWCSTHAMRRCARAA